MVITFQDKLKLIKKFITICQNNNIWYAADLETLLAIFLNKSKLVFTNQFEVMMTYWSYEKLKRLFPNHLVDNFNHQNHRSFISFFIDDNINNFDIKKIKKAKKIIKIRLVLPTTIKKVKKFNNIFWNISQKIRGKNKNFKDACNFLYEERNQGFFWLDKKIFNISKSWSPVVNFSITTKKINNLEINTVENSDFLLNLWFGKKWNKINV